MVEKTPGDFEEIVKKFHKNFRDLFFFWFKVRSKTKSPNIRSKFLKSFLEYVGTQSQFYQYFFQFFFQNLQKFFPIFLKFIRYTFHKIFYLTCWYKGYMSKEAKFLEPVSSTPVMLSPKSKFKFYSAFLKFPPTKVSKRDLA